MNTKDEELLSNLLKNQGDYPLCLKLIKDYGDCRKKEGYKEGITQGFEDACAGFIRGYQGYSIDADVEDLQ